jgi:hypothetical protein
MIKSPVNELLKSLLSIYASHAGALLEAFVVVYRDFPSNNSKLLHMSQFWQSFPINQKQ